MALVPGRFCSVRRTVLGHLALLAGLAGATGAASGRGMPGTGTAQPAGYVSPSRVYSLFVDPSERYGRGAADYRMLRNGVEIWAGSKPYTLRAVVVTDEGLVAGFAYRTGPELPESKDEPRAIGGPVDPPEYLHIVVLGADGGEILNDETERVHPPYLSNPPAGLFPSVHQFLVDPPNDRLIARVQARGARWWTFRLSTGESLGRFDPKERLRDTTNLQFVVDAQPVAGTPLLLVHWFVKGPDFQAKDESGRFMLLDAEFRPVWSFDAVHDYAQIDLYAEASIGLGPGDYFEKHPAIMRTSEPRRFSLRLFAENKEVTFSVGRDAEGYTITELGRINVPADEDLALDASSLAPLDYLGPLELGTPSDPSPFQHLSTFTFDRNGHIHFLTQTPDYAVTLHHADASGVILGERPFESGTVAWADISRSADSAFVVSRSKKREGGRGYESSSTWVDLVTGEEKPTGPEISDWVSSLGWFPDGGFVVLDSDKSHSARLTRFNADGTIRWRQDSPTGDLKSVAALADGKVATLSFRSVQVLDSQGSLIQEIDLTGPFGQEEHGGRPFYLHEIVADNDGGFLIADSSRPPVVLRYHADGSLRSRWSPRHADGGTFRIRPGIRVAPDGRLWTSDGNAIMRLTDDGVVDRVLGPEPDKQRLDEIVALTVDRRGQIYAVAKGSGIVHVFDRSGTRLRILEPDPKDMAGTFYQADIVVDEVGEVFVKKPPAEIYLPPNEYLRFSASGERLESVEVSSRTSAGSIRGEEWTFQPGTGYRCGMTAFRGDVRLIMVEPPNKLIREVRRRPNGRWFGDFSHLAMGPDGSMAVLDRDIFGGNDFDVDLFSAQGEPLRTIRLPSPRKHYSAIAYDGRRVVVTGVHEIAVLDTADDRVELRALNDTGADRGSRSVHILPGSNEILLFDGGGTRLQRYRLPSVGVTGNTQSAAEPGEDSLDPTEAAILSSWVKEYMEVVDSIPPRGPCVVYLQTIDRGERILSEADALKLPEEERRELRTMNPRECGVGHNEPRVYARLLDLLASQGVTQVEGARVVDFGCCDFRHLQSLARIGADVRGVLVGYSAAAMCNDWDDVGELKGPGGKIGNLEVIRAYEFHRQAGGRELGGGYDLITFRNLLQAVPEEDYFSPEPWKQTYVASTKEEFVQRIREALAPGGYALSYSVGVSPFVDDCCTGRSLPFVPESSISRSVWEEAGFEVIAFDRDDRGAALGLGLELGWDQQAGPLETAIRARYTLVRRPVER